VSDVVDSTPAARIVSVTSKEPKNDRGDGNTAPNWEITGDLTLNLRAERSGLGNGRIYAIAAESRREPRRQRKLGHAGRDRRGSQKKREAVSSLKRIG
jgi:hypothetical protein